MSTQALSSSAPSVLPLAGTWQLSLDRENVGIVQRWFEKELPEKIMLPGDLASQGIGDSVTLETHWIGDIFDRSYFTASEYEAYRKPGNIKVPFWLQPDQRYIGAAWYSKEVFVPKDWQGRRLLLSLERPHWKTTVWLDGQELGSNDSLSIPHDYDLGTAVQPGKHRLCIRVDNSLVVDIGVNSHSISDHTQGNWNGIIGRIELLASEPVWIDDLQLYPHVASRTVSVRGRLGGVSDAQSGLTVNLSVDGRPTLEAPVAGDGSFTAEYPLGDDARTWDEFSPALHCLTASLANGEKRTVTFGLREVSTVGTHIAVNGKPIFIRGTLECAIFPKTGFPPTDIAAWKRVLSIARAHGLNSIRFHSWCPPEAAFVAGDEMGFYFQIEAASWPNQSTTLGDGKPVDAWLLSETERILRTYGNHPSFLLMAAGNEPGGDHANPYLANWVNTHKAKDARRLFTSSSAWPQLPENQYHVTSDPRIQQWGAGLSSRINAKPPETTTDYRDYINQRTVPVVSHEIGQWCVYPNFDEIPKYTGYLKPKNFEIFRETLAAHHMADQAHDFLMASGKLQTLCYKEEIESALRTPGMGGFQLLDLHDFPGQGTALVGVLDPFWDSKGYVTPAEYSRFCSPTVPLLRLSKRVFTSDEMLDAGVEVAHFGAAALRDVTPIWKIVAEDGKVVQQGELPPVDIAIGNGISLGHIQSKLEKLPTPARYQVVVGLKGIQVDNDWDIWIYPTTVATPIPTGVLHSSEFDEQAIAALDAGTTVFLTVPPSQARNVIRGEVKLGFSSIFWNTAWTTQQPPTTLGILCNPRHPALADFPTEFHSNWQWWYLVSRSGALILDDMPADLRPIVQVVDDWVTNHKLGLVFEARVGKGRLLVCSIDLQQADNPVARQLVASLLRYLGSPQFNPAVTLSVEQVHSLIKPHS